MLSPATWVAALAGAASVSAGSVLARHPHPVPASATELVTRNAPVLSLDVDLDVGPIYIGPVGLEAEVDLYVGIEELKVAVDIDISIGTDFITKPAIEISLAGLEVAAVVDLSVTAAIELQVIELKVLEAIEVAVPGLLEVDVKAGLALDLLVKISALIDAQVGVEISFGKEALVVVDLVTLEVSLVDSGIVAKAVPISIGLDIELEVCVTIDLALRARIAAGITAEVDLLGLADIGAGVYVGVWLNIADLHIKVCVGSGGACPLEVEVFLQIAAAVIVDLDVDVSDVLSLDVAPVVIVVLATVDLELGCPSRPHFPWIPTHPGGGHHDGPSTTASGPSGSITSAPATTSAPSDVGSGSTTTGTWSITGCGAKVQHCPSSLTTVTVYTTEYLCSTTNPSWPKPTGEWTVKPIENPKPSTEVCTEEPSGPQTVAPTPRPWGNGAVPTGGYNGQPATEPAKPVPTGDASGSWAKPTGSAGAWSPPAGYSNNTAPPQESKGWSVVPVPSGSYTVSPPPTDSIAHSGADTIKGMSAGLFAVLAAAMML